jgi:hypothetical protein
MSVASTRMIASSLRTSVTGIADTDYIAMLTGGWTETALAVSAPVRTRSGLLKSLPAELVQNRGALRSIDL